MKLGGIDSQRPQENLQKCGEGFYPKCGSKFSAKCRTPRAVLKTPVRAPKANAFCERLIGSLRRECLDWVIPLGERHLRALLREWVHTTIGDGRT